MTRNKLLLVLAGMLFAVAGRAAEWVKPTTPKTSTPSAFVVSEEKGADATCYLWNEECKAFLGEGNDWKSRASFVAEKGIELYFQKYKVNDVWQEGNYYFNCYTVANQSGRWDWMWINLTEGEGGFASTDYNEPGCYRAYGDGFPLWGYEVNGNYVRILVGSQQPVWSKTEQGTQFYMGKPATAAEDNTIVYSNCTYSDNIDWTVVTKADYDAFQLSLQTYYAAMELDEAIQVSKGKYDGIDLSVVEAIYNNTNSTLAQLQAALAQIPELEKQFVAGNISSASVENPYDATAYIKNPNYDGNVDGWQGMSTSWYNSVGEYWTDNTKPYDMYQEITDLPNGVYQIQVHSLHRIGNPDWDHYKTGVLADDAEYRRTSQIYANNYWMLNNDVTSALSTEPVHDGQYIHNGDYYFPDGQAYTDKAFNTLDMYNNSLFAAVTDGKLRIGIRCENREQYSWTSLDTWRLTYYGNSADALDLLKGQLKLNIKAYEEDVLIQKTLMEQYKQALADLDAAADYAAVEAAYTKAMGLFYDMEKSRNAYNKYVALVDEILPQTEDLDCEDNDILVDYLVGTAEGTFGYILEETPLNVEELEAQMKWMNDQLALAIKNTVEEGREYTGLIANADFTQRDLVASGWSLDNWKGQTIVGQDGTSKYYVAEIWNYKSYDLYQTLTGMPAGIYEITVPAVYRACDNDYTHPATSEIYINGLAKNVMKASEDAVTNETAVSAPDGYPNWESIDGYNCYNQGSTSWDGPWPNDFQNEINGVTMYWPGSTGGAGVAFNAGRYINKVYGIVGEDGILRFGVRSKNQSGKDNDWCCLGRITMKYMGSNADAIAGLKEEVEAQADIYNNISDKCYAGYKNDIEDALLKVLKANTKDEITDAIAGINEVFGNIDKSISLYKQLDHILGADGTGFYAAALRAGDSEKEAKAAEYQGGVNDGIYDNEKAQAILDEISNDPLVDVIYIRGGLEGYTGDSWDSYEFPMTRNAEGKYVGTAKFRDERHGNIGKYAGNRSLVVFHRLGQDICSADNNTRFLDMKTEARKLKINDNTSWFITWGGEWEFTIDLKDSTMTCRPVGDMLYKSQIYAVGNLLDNHWALNETTANHWELIHQGNGIYQGSIAFNPGVERGEVTLFASDMWLTGNWGDGRIGSVEDALQLTDGQEVVCDRFEGDRKWILDPTHHYLATYDLNKGTVRFDVRDLKGGDAEADPLMISNYEDMLMMRSYMRQGETHYFALANNIHMEGKGWSQLNGPGEQNGRENQRWVSIDGCGNCIFGYRGDTGLQSAKNNSFVGTLGGAVKNLGFVDVDIVENTTFLADYGVSNASSVAVLAGVLGTSTHPQATEVENVFATGNIDGGMFYTGALAGSVNGKTNIKNAYSQVNIESLAEYAGGLVGRINGALDLQNVYVAATVSNSTPIYASFTSAAPAANFNNVVNWTNYSFVDLRGKDTATNIYNYNGSNHADLQKTVVAFDPAVWSCGTGADEYPILKAFAETMTGVNGIQMANTSNKIYTIGGVAVSGNANRLPAGIYIINGKKVVK